MWFDSHCHLYDLGDDGAITEALQRAAAVSVEGMVVPGVDLPTSRRAIELADVHGLWAAVGIHPSEAGDGGPIEEIEELLASPQVVAIGETGLDFYRDGARRDVQQSNFAAHIALARKHSKPLIIHTRESAGMALDMLEQQGSPPSVVFHCWSGDEEELARALAMGAHVSFAGNVSFKSAEPLRRAARTVPRDRLLVETDSPYLTPVPHRGHPNEPAYVALVGAAVAEARGEELEDVAGSTAANARRLFGVLEP